MTSNAKTVADCLAGLLPERRSALEKMLREAAGSRR